MGNYNMQKYDEEIQICSEEDLILVWSRKPKKDEKEAGITEDIIMYHNCRTGIQSSIEREVISNRPYQLINRNSSKISATYWKATSDCKFLCCVIGDFSTKAIKPGETRKWEEQVRYYFSKNKETILPAYYWGTVTEDGKHRIEFNPCKASNLCCDYTKLRIINGKLGYLDVERNYFRQEVKKVFSPVVTIGGNRMIELYSPERFDYFWSYKEPIVKTGPKQKRINELVSIPLPEITVPDLKKFKLENSWYRYDKTKYFAVFNKIKDGLVCIRTMAAAEFDDMPGEQILCESGRIYVDGKKVIACKPNNFGEYVSTNLSSADDQWNYPIIDFNPDDVKGTALEYFGSIIDELPREVRCVAIKNFLSYPILEQLYKGGLKKAIIASFRHNYGCAMETLSSMLDIDKNAKNFYSMIGLNKNQLDMVKEKWDSYTEEELRRVSYSMSKLYEIKHVKNILDKRNVADIDDETFKKILDFVTYPFARFYSASESLRLLFKHYENKTAISMIEPIKSLADERIEVQGRWGLTNLFLVDIYRDYLTMVVKMNCDRSFSVHFSDADDVKRMHDAAVIVFNTKENAYKNDAFISAVKKCHKYAYSDENYSIVVPALPADLAREGIELKHCVKSYIDRVISGYTNILFLRKNEEIDKPFFTIEISNKGDIEQIHGFGNRNADTEPDMLYFIDNWVKAKKLNKNNFNKVR